MKTDNPKVSFVMAAKNRDDLIGESIKSVLGQTIGQWELIIVDDHSDPDDKTESIVKAVHDERIKYFRLPDKNGRGLACARNYGVYQSTAEIIAIQDSDDLSMANRAELIINTYAQFQWDVFYGNHLFLNNETGETSLPTKPPIEFDLEKYINHQFYIPDCSAAIKRDLMLHYPYNSIYNIGLDFDFYTRLAKDNRKFYFCDEIIYKYRVHENSMTQGKGFKDIEKEILDTRGWSRHE